MCEGGEYTEGLTNQRQQSDSEVFQRNRKSLRGNVWRNDGSLENEVSWNS